MRTYLLEKKNNILYHNPDSKLLARPMDKATEMGKTSATGSFHLFIGKTVSTVILALGTIVLGWFILRSDYGLYAISLIPASTFFLFQDWGVNEALTKYCASYRAANKEADLRKIIIVGLGFEVATGLALTLVSLLLAHFMASTVFNKPGAALLIAIGSLSVFLSSLVKTAQNVFVGFERMHLYSYTLIFQAVPACVLTPLLVILGYGALGAVVGYTLSTAISGIAGIGLLYFSILRKLPDNSKTLNNNVQTLKMHLTYGFPLGIANILGGLLPQAFSIIMASLVTVAVIGDYKIATNFAILLTFLTLPISTVLFPVFSKVDPKNEPQLLKSVFASSVKYASILLVPATMALIVLSQPIIYTIYGGKYPSAPFLLALTAAGTLLVIFGTQSVANLFSGVGETKLMSKMQILQIIIGIPTGLLSALWFGLPGIIVAGIFAGVPSMFIGLYMAWKRFGTRIDLKASAKILLASLLAAGLTYLFLSVFFEANWMRLLIGLFIYLAAYLVAIPLLRAVNQMDVYNLQTITSEMGVASRVFNIPLKIIERILKIRSKNSEKKVI